MLAFARNEVKRCKRWRSTHGNKFDEAWKRYIDLYAGKHYDHKSGTDQLTVNLIFATKNVMAPAVAINNPKFTVNARRPDDAPNAVITEEVLNYLWRTNKYQSDFRLAVDDWIIMGHGWLKVGYKFVKPPEEKSTDIPADGNATDEGVDEGIDDREDVEGNVESELIVEDDRPFVERISPFDMYVDPDARHPKEMRWIAQRTWRAVQDVSVDDRYSTTARKKVSGSSWSRWGEDGDGRSDDDKPDKGAVTFAEVIEFYDIKRGKVCTFAMDAEDSTTSGFLIRPKKIPYALGHPFVMVRNYEVPDTFYPMGDVQQIESLQLELNETRNQMLNYRKKFRRAWVYSKDLFDRDGLQALESEQDNVMIPVQGDGDPAKAISPVPPSITPSEFFDQSAMISDDIDRVSGVSDYQRGAQAEIKRTATEAAMIQDAANARAQDRLAKIELTLADLGARVIALMQQYMTGEKVARLTSVPAQAWVHYDADYIAGQFDFEVAAGSTEPQNETFRRQAAMQLVDASMPFLEMQIADPVALYRHILTKGFGIKNTTSFVNQQGAPPQGVQPTGAPPGPPGMEQVSRQEWDRPSARDAAWRWGFHSRVPVRVPGSTSMESQITPQMLQELVGMDMGGGSGMPMMPEPAMPLEIPKMPPVTFKVKRGSDGKITEITSV